MAQADWDQRKAREKKKRIREGVRSREDDGVGGGGRGREVVVERCSVQLMGNDSPDDRLDKTPGEDETQQEKIGKNSGQPCWKSRLTE